MLKYRFRHLAKADVEFNYKKISLVSLVGILVLCQTLVECLKKMLAEILPGLKEYREKYPQGNFVIDSGLDIR